MPVGTHTSVIYEAPPSLPLEEQWLAGLVTARQMLGAPLLLTLLEQAVAASSERLKLTAPEQVMVASMRSHVVG